MELEHLIVKSKDSIMDFDMYVYCIIIASWAAIKKIDVNILTLLEVL